MSFDTTTANNKGIIRHPLLRQRYCRDILVDSLPAQLRAQAAGECIALRVNVARGIPRARDIRVIQPRQLAAHLVGVVKTISGPKRRL